MMPDWIVRLIGGAAIVAGFAAAYISGRVLLDREKPRTEIFVEHVGGEADGALRRH